MSVPERMKRKVSDGPRWVYIDGMWEDFEKEWERMERDGMAGEDAPGK